MAKVKFDDLPVDIKSLVIEKITRPTELADVCLVNKELHELAVKVLYRYVSLDLGSPKDHQLSAFLSPKNIGLKYIKSIRLHLAKVRDECGQQQQAQLVIRMILEFLPEDTLEEFRFGHADTYGWSLYPWTPFSADSLLLLNQKQRKMKLLEVMALDRDIIPKLKKNEKMQREMFQHVRRLALYPENRESLRLGQFYLQKTKILEDLNIHTNFHDTSVPPDPRPHREGIELSELNDSATAPGLLTSTLFGHMMPFESCEPFQHLKSLQLHKVSLRFCADSWCKVFNFNNIEALHVHRCPGADSLFGELCKARSLPKELKRLQFRHDDNAESEALLALDGFLCLVSGIRELTLDLEHVRTLPSATGIARHAKTLRLLNVHCSWRFPYNDDNELVWSNQDFEKICKSCTLLEQLSCAWPQTSLIRTQSEDWGAFADACGHLKELVTLNITTWPRTWSTSKPSALHLPRAVYENLLRALAQRTFELAEMYAFVSSPEVTSEASSSLGGRLSKLRLIAFGISERIYEREEPKNQYLYLRSSAQDAENRRRIYATPIMWCLRPYIEPRSEILEFVLSREARPPFRDRESGVGLGRWDGPDDEDDSVDV